MLSGFRLNLQMTLLRNALKAMVSLRKTLSWLSCAIPSYSELLLAKILL